MTALNIIKSWFETDDVPTQAQFWAMFESYWHKSEKLAQSDITNLAEALEAKANREAFEAHLNDSAAHHDEFLKTKIYALGELQIWKAPGNENKLQLESGDRVKGFIEGQFVEAIYQGGNKDLLASYKLLES